MQGREGGKPLPRDWDRRLFVQLCDLHALRPEASADSNENENRNKTGEDTYAGALRAPRAGSPAFVSVFVLIFGFLTFDFRFVLTHFYDVL